MSQYIKHMGKGYLIGSMLGGHTMAWVRLYEERKNPGIKNITSVACFVATTTLLGPSAPIVCLWMDSIMAITSTNSTKTSANENRLEPF